MVVSADDMSEVLIMKNIFRIAGCSVGSGMIGFFANQLNTFLGSLLFALGIVMLVSSIILITKQNKE